MSFLSWMRKQISSSGICRRNPRPAARKPATFRPQLEALEERWLPSFAAPTTIPISQPAALATADLNGDGKPDLIAATSSGFNVMLNMRKGHFASTAYSTQTSMRTTALAVGDFNGDGKLDVVVRNDPSSFPTAGPNPASLSVFFGFGNGTFGNPQTFYVLPEESGISSLAVGDFNGDGRLDIAAAGYNSVTVVLNVGGQAFLTAGTTYHVAAFSALAPSQVAVGDFNGDSKPDLAVTSYYNGTVSVLLNNGDGTGTFGTEHQYTVGGSPTALAVGDFYGHGLNDLAVAITQQSATGTSSGVSMLVNNGNGSGTFSPDRVYAVGGVVNSIAVGDFNRDGLPDIVTTGTEMDVLQNNGQGAMWGTFYTAQKVGPAGSSVVVADFNGDGFADLAQIDASAASIDVLLNKADWTTGSKGHK
jgi:hypothetical protein